MGRSNKRLALFMGLALFFLVALMARTFYVQVFAAPALQAKADGQSIRTVELAAPRGVIYDCDGEVLAMSRTMTSVYANPRKVKDPVAASRALAPILGLSESDLLAKLSSDWEFRCLAHKIDPAIELNHPSEFRYLARKIDPAVGKKVKALQIAGVGLCSEAKRVYPKGALAPQLLGFVGDDDKGLAGLELQYDALLAGEPGKVQVVSDRLGNRLSTISVKEAQPGTSIALTIDADIQYETERVLGEAVEQFQAKKACAVVIDPKTGGILAMASTPVFDANDFASEEVQEPDRRNMTVTDQYEPGSTFKMVVTAAALEAGLVTPQTVFKLGRTITVYDLEVHEAHDEGTPPVREFTVTQILAKSSNVGAVTLGLQVGKTRLVEMIRKFGFTQKLDVDFPGEIAGQMLDPKRWSGTTIANVPMGQGIACSPLQLAVAYAAIANGGVMMQPHFVQDHGELWSRRVISKTVAHELLEMLTVTVEDGTGKLAAVKGYAVAGKTGTAQKVRESGGYYADRFVASFVGMVPADDPRLVILVTVDDPATQHLGSSVAAPAFAKIADFALKRLGIAPTSSD